ncbi:MAG: HAMP domain-containing histidine kinase [Rhodobacteraceae bacterium]|nr:HAMP domain-containing histidine kinase [Paracoccaceae bacterium]
MRSIRSRAVNLGAMWSFAILAFTATFLYLTIQKQNLFFFDEALLLRHSQLVSAVRSDGLGGANRFLRSQEYKNAYSGFYWQVEAQNGMTIQSTSLVENSLVLPATGTGRPQFWTGSGPDGPFRGVFQRVPLPDGSTATAAVAVSLRGFWTEAGRLLITMLLSFVAIGFLCIGGIMMLTNTALRPLRRLTDDVLNRWERGAELKASEYPEEVTPLINEINELMERNRLVVERGRRRAADLAHGLGTPSAILGNELDKFAAQGVDTEAAREALERIDRQVKRSLARIRAANVPAYSLGGVSIETSVGRIVKLLSRSHENAHLSFDIQNLAGYRASMDPHDLEESLGNLLENATKWAKTTIRVSIVTENGMLAIRIEDDGPGIPEEHREDVLKSGTRLDTSTKGTGIGLAITAELLEAYGGSILLDRSDDLGGLCVTFRVPGRRHDARQSGQA